MQRPTDRDAQTAAEEFADSLSELPEARLVSTPGRPKEVLLSDDPPDARAKRGGGRGSRGKAQLRYPEWDYRSGLSRARRHGRLLPAAGRPAAMGGRYAGRAPLDAGSRYAGASRCCARSACGCASNSTATRSTSRRTSTAMPTSAPGCRWRRRCTRRSIDARRDMAIMLLVDVSGSTDGWISGRQARHRCRARGTAAGVHRPGGHGRAVCGAGLLGRGAAWRWSVRTVKRFDEPYGNDVARRIAGARAGTLHARGRGHSPCQHDADARAGRAPACCCCCPTASRTTSTTTRAATASRTCGRR